MVEMEGAGEVGFDKVDLQELREAPFFSSLTLYLSQLQSAKCLKLEKFGGVILALIIIGVITVPTYFGLHYIYVFFGAAAYLIVALVLYKFTICIKLETDGAVAVAKAIEANDLEEAKKYAIVSNMLSTILKALISNFHLIQRAILLKMS